MEKQTTFIPALKYDWLTNFFDPFIRTTMAERRFKTALLRQANIKADDRVLDFGVGTATLSLLAKELEPESRITGVDVDEKIILIARRKVKSSRADIVIDQYDGRTLPYLDGSFDKILSSLVFHHLSQEQKRNSLNELRRVLRANGELHIADWGKAQSPLMRLAFLPVQLLDGFETTADSVRGKLPNFLSEAGFFNVRETTNFSTAFGTLSLYSANR